MYENMQAIKCQLKTYLGFEKMHGNYDSIRRQKSEEWTIKRISSLEFSRK